jgi:hypothetical protein
MVDETEKTIVPVTDVNNVGEPLASIAAPTEGKTATSVAVAPPAPPAKKVRTELKVSIIIKADKIFMAAQANDTDPKMTTFTGDLDSAIAMVRIFIDQCNAEWDVSAKNPEMPKPPPPPAPVRTATTASSSSGKGKSKTTAAAVPPAAPKAQPRFF